MAKKRLTFECWNCSRKYSLLRELLEKKKLFVACPFCKEDAVVDLTPYKRPTINTYKTGTQSSQQEIEQLELPEILPTQKPPSEEIAA